MIQGRAETSRKGKNLMTQERTRAVKTASLHLQVFNYIEMFYFIWFSEESEVDGTRICACPRKMLPRGDAETQTQGSPEAELHSSAVLFWNTKAGVCLYLPRDLNASLRFSLNSTATFSWQMRPSFSHKRQLQKLPWHDPPLACKYICLVQGWAPTQEGANLSSFTQGKKPPIPVQW